METPALIQHPNFFTALHKDLRNLICGYLDGRSFARLGACSVFLRHYESQADEVWKCIFINQNPFTTKASITNWRIEVVKQVLFKRNIKARNVVCNILNLGLRETDTQAFIGDKLIVASGGEVLMFDGHGQFMGKPKLPYTMNNHSLKVAAFNGDSYVITGSNFLYVSGQNGRISFSSDAWERSYSYNKNWFAYNLIRGNINLVNLKTNSVETVKNIPYCWTVHGISENRICYRHNNEIILYDIETKKNEIYPRIPGTFLDVTFRYPLIIYRNPPDHAVNVYSFETKKITIINPDRFIDIYGHFVYYAEANNLMRYDTREGELTTFASTIGTLVQLRAGPERVIAIAEDKVMIWNPISKGLIKEFTIDEGRALTFHPEVLLFNNILVKKNIGVFCAVGGTDLDFWDVVTGEKLNSLTTGARGLLHYHEGKMLIQFMKSGILFYSIAHFDKPLPLRLAQRASQAAQSTLNYLL